MEIIYSVTVKPDKEIEQAFIEWLTKEHIAEVVSTGCFDSHRLYKILEEDETHGSSYNIQYITTEMSRYFDYIHKYSAELRQKGAEKFGNKLHAFRTVLKQL